MDREELLKLLTTAMNNKHRSCRQYEIYRQQAPPGVIRETVHGMLEREKQHLELLQSIAESHSPRNLEKPRQDIRPPFLPRCGPYNRRGS